MVKKINNYNMTNQEKTNTFDLENSEYSTISKPETIEDDFNDTWFHIQNTKSLNFRSSPRYDPNNIIKILTPADRFKVIENISGADWSKIKLVDGSETFIGYVLRKYTNIPDGMI